MLSSIRIRITVTCVAIVVASLLITTCIIYLVTQRAAYATLNQNLSTAVYGNAQALSQWATSRGEMVKAVSASAIATDPTSSLVQLEKSGGFQIAYAGFPDRHALFSRDRGIAASYDPTSRPWYQGAVSAGKLIITAPYTDAVTRSLIVSFSMPIVESGQLKAVVAANVTLAAVNGIVKAIKPSVNSLAVLVAADGTIVANGDDRLNLKPVTELVPGLTPDALAALVTETEAVEMNVQGVPKFLKAQQVPGTSWYLVVAFDKDDALAKLRSVVRVLLLTLVVVVACAGLIMGALTASSFRRLSDVRLAMEEIGSAGGDLTKRLAAEGKDEVAQIARAFNRFADKIVEVLRDIRDSSEAVKGAAAEIAQGNVDLASRTEESAASLEETAASMDQLTGTVTASSEAAVQAGELAATASGIAHRGGEVVADVVLTMKDIAASSSKIAEIIGVINGIAFQTNILALNAAVEAARAGEQGRGFAVVAGEVRSLAQRSAQAAKEIERLITDSVEKVGSGKVLVESAGTTMDHIVMSVKKVTDILEEMKSSTIEQTVGITQVNQAVAQLDATTQQNAALVEQASAGAELLREQAFRLTDVVGQFKLN
jgi:methyl-accepting chemotaxis protein